MDDKEGNLRVWWIPQIPMKAFTAPVASLVQAKLLLKTLAEYDLFQYANNVKGDYTNAGGLRVFENGEWVDWCDEDGRTIDDVDIAETGASMP